MLSDNKKFHGDSHRQISRESKTNTTLICKLTDVCAVRHADNNGLPQLFINEDFLHIS